MHRRIIGSAPQVFRIEVSTGPANRTAEWRSLNMSHTANRYLALASTAIVLSVGVSPARAAPAGDDWYVAVGGTVTAERDPQTVIFNAPVAPASLTINDNLKSPGYGGLIALGHRFGSFRVEAEVGHTYDKAEAYTATAPITLTLPQIGGFSTTRFMANVYFDAPVGGRIEPHLGGGIGYGTFREKTFAARAFAPTAPPVQLIDDRLHHFAWQAIGGFSVPIAPKVRAMLQVRYLDLGTATGQDTRGQPITTRLNGFNFDAGIRFSF